MQGPKEMIGNLWIKLADPKAKPLRAHPTDAGMDLFSTERHIIYPNSMQMVDTGVAVQIPVNFVGLVFSRSGQGKLRISLANSVGVIDSDYRGNIKVMIVNEGDDPYEINPYSTRVCQLVITPIWIPDLREYKGTDSNWNDTSRGTNGFGSTN